MIDFVQERETVSAELRTLRERRAVNLLDDKGFKGADRIVELEAKEQALNDAEAEARRRRLKSQEHANRSTVGLLSAEIARHESDRLEALDDAEASMLACVSKLQEVVRLSEIIRHKAEPLNRAKGGSSRFATLSALVPREVAHRLSQLIGQALSPLDPISRQFGELSWSVPVRRRSDGLQWGWSELERHTTCNSMVELIGPKKYKTIGEQP